MSFDSLSFPNTPPNSPILPPPPYREDHPLSVAEEINRLNTYDFGSLAPFIGAREEEGQEIFYDPTEPYPIFPFIRNRTYPISPKFLPHFADQVPIGFTNSELERLWTADAINIDGYVKHAQTTHNDILVPWTYEYEYHGVHHRLTIDHKSPLHRLSGFTHGTSIEFGNCNGPNFRYVVDHCVYQDKINAYLKVICFDIAGHRYDICSYRPPLILTIPRSHCHVRIHPNLIPVCQRPLPSRPFYTKLEMEMVDEILKGYHGQKRSWLGRLFCR